MEFLCMGFLGGFYMLVNIRMSEVIRHMSSNQVAHESMLTHIPRIGRCFFKLTAECSQNQVILPVRGAGLFTLFGLWGDGEMPIHGGIYCFLSFDVKVEASC